MPCYRIGNAIVCTSRPLKPPAKCACGKLATRECDWRLQRFVGPRGAVLKKPRVVTCDAPICDDCTHEPAPGKDLCPPHAIKWKSRAAHAPVSAISDTKPDKVAYEQQDLPLDGEAA